VILNFGLGMNYFVRPDHAIALTVLDKFGLDIIKYSNANYSFECGPFVGGFLDALVRTAASSQHQYWLAGLTFGFPRAFHTDFGLELHVAAAMPFSTGGDGVQFVAGFALTVPVSAVFEPTGK
jgi:hypothetical protein